MIITLTGPVRRKGIFFWVCVSAVSLLAVNLFLYFTVYGDTKLTNGLGDSSSHGNVIPTDASNEESEKSSSGSVAAVWNSANDFISSVTGGSSDSVEANVIKALNGNNRNKRLSSFFLPSYYQGEELEELKAANPVIAQFDRRLLPAFWVHLINKNILSDDEVLPASFKLPFNWDLLNNYAVKIQQLKYFEKVVKNKLNCEAFSKIAPKNLPDTFLKNFCLNFNYEDPNFSNEYNVPFLVLRKIDQYLSDVDWRKLHGMLYSLTNSPIPENVLFLGGVGSEGRSLLVPLEKVSNGKNNLASLGEVKLSTHYTTLTENYIEDQLAAHSGLSRSDILARGISLYEEWVRFNELIAGKELKVETDLTYFPSKPMVVGKVHEVDFKPVELSEDDFKFYLPDEEARLQKLVDEAPSGANTKQLQHMQMWANQVLDPKFEEPWYYGIPSIEGEHLDHYDWRFFSVFTLKEDQELHTAILHRLSRVWFRICNKFDVPSWMNHGPLIGWYWSGMTLPYDFDLDLQMPIQSLHRISKYLNNTLVYDFTDEGEYVNDDVKIDNKAEIGIRSYLIDIDPLYFDRNQVRSTHNDLDARLIDTETGIYIDLTAVSDFQSGNRYDLEEQKRYFEKSTYNGYRIMVPTHWKDYLNEEGNYKVNRDKANVAKDEMVKTIDKFVKDKGTKDSRAEDSPTKFLDGYIHDKHFHTYKLSELSPLVPTFYENSISYMPSNWKKNTLIEYQGDSCLRNSYYSKHHFLEKLMLWVDYKDCPIWNEENGNFKEGQSENQVSNECLSTNAKLEEQYKRSVHYANLHNIYRTKLLKNQGDILKVENYDEEIVPLLKKFDGHLFVPEPFIERHLY